MYTFLMIIGVLMALLLIVVVLLQSSKGDGLSGTFGGSSISATFGTRRAADALSKLSWWLGGGLLVIALVINLFFLPGQTSKAERESIIQKAAAQQVPTTPALPQNILPGNENKATNSTGNMNATDNKTGAEKK